MKSTFLGTTWKEGLKVVRQKIVGLTLKELNIGYLTSSSPAIDGLLTGTHQKIEVTTVGKFLLPRRERFIATKGSLQVKEPYIYPKVRDIVRLEAKDNSAIHVSLIGVAAFRSAKK